jgi:hypothetical protein
MTPMRTGPFRSIAVVSAIISIILVVVSAVFALNSLGWQGVTGLAWNKIIVGLWVIIPPIWFWLEWTFFSFGLSRDELEDLKHSQELSRNIWVAVVVLLTAIFGIQWPAG